MVLNYYNEFEPYVAQWLRNLIAADLIPYGVVDTRSICDVRPSDLKGFTGCHFFAGLGGWPLSARLAGWPDDRPIWTGSCPCQPFSNAGKRAGFDDARHLWPAFRDLIGQCRPTVIIGEQVASATEWLRVVRSDLEAMEYAVGAMPIEAASAGADHLRDRYWFVGDDTRLGRGERWPKSEFRSGRDSVASDGCTKRLADAHNTRPQRRVVLPECPGERALGAHGVADSDLFGACEIRTIQRSGQFGGFGGDTQARNSCDLAESNIPNQRGYARNPRSTSSESSSDPWAANGNAADGTCASGLSWVIGADGKARRLKSGIRLLVNGISGRVAVERPGQDPHHYSRIGALRALGNAIDTRPAVAFLTAYMECCP